MRHYAMPTEQYDTPASPENDRPDLPPGMASGSYGHPQSPGVYTRAEHHRPQNDLDLLWSPNKVHPKEERSPVLFFIAGFVACALIAGGIFFVFNRPHEVKTGNTEFLNKPIDRVDKLDEALKTKDKAVMESSKTDPQTGVQTGGTGTVITTYTVKSGDSLGSIALKFYKSQDPKYLQKLQRANNMKNPNSLQLGQQLAIPPAN